MEPIFDFRAQTIAWLDGETAFSAEGRPAAFIRHGAVFAAQDGHYLGQSDGGVFRDRLGGIVAFVRGSAPGAALTPPPDVRPAPSAQSRDLPEPAPIPAGLPHRAKPLLNKSSLSWERFISGCEAHLPWNTRR